MSAESIEGIEYARKLRAASTGDLGTVRFGPVNLRGGRILVEVRPVSRSEKVPHGVLLTDTLLMGKVLLVAGDVPEDLRAGDEVWFRRPMNEIPAFALLPYTDVEIVRERREE